MRLPIRCGRGVTRRGRERLRLKKRIGFYYHSRSRGTSRGRDDPAASDRLSRGMAEDATPRKLSAQESGSSQPNVKVLQSVIDFAFRHARVARGRDGGPQPAPSRRAGWCWSDKLFTVRLLLFLILAETSRSGGVRCEPITSLLQWSR
jgi:hypothetical protein